MKAILKRTHASTGQLAALGLLTVASIQNVHAETDPLGGKPAPGAEVSVPDLQYQIAYQRSFEAVLWSMPAICQPGVAGDLD